MSDIRERIEAAIYDYRAVFPRPNPLAPNLQLASEALAELDKIKGMLAFWLDLYDEFWVDAPEDGWRFHRDVAAIIGWEAPSE